MKYCKWVCRPGTAGSFWAYTPCKPGFNYLSRINRWEDIKDAYDNSKCPICRKPIECDIELCKEQKDGNDSR